MNSILKIIGLILVFSVCTAYGFMKSSSLKKREKYLETLINCVEELRQSIRFNGASKEKLINKVFICRNLLLINNKNIVFPENSCDDETQKILCDFLTSFGTEDIESELKRAELCKLSLERRYLNLQKTSFALAKIYRTMGLSVGAVICLLFI